jgi:hypothetical protein
MEASEFIVKFYNKAYEDKYLDELTQSPVSAISGISESDAQDLKTAFNIETVEDLAINKYVRIAQGINVFSECEGEVLDKVFDSEEFQNLAAKPVSAISGISEGDAALLDKAFSIQSIRDLSENKYVSIAQTTVDMASLCQFLAVIA